MPGDRAADPADLRQGTGPDAGEHGEDEDDDRDEVERVQVHGASIGEVRGSRLGRRAP